MSLGWKLFLVFLGFLAILATVIVASFRARKRARELGNDLAAQRVEDAHVMAVIFSSIVGGMALTLITAWLVFF